MNFVTSTEGVDIAIAHIVTVDLIEQDSIDKPTYPAEPFILFKYKTSADAIANGRGRDWVMFKDRYDKAVSNFEKKMKIYEENNVTSTNYEITTVNNETYIVNEHPFKIEEVVDEI